MNELDEVWSAMLTDAAVNASAAGRHEVAQYLRLKATNDAIRSRGVAWLVEAFVQAASDAMRIHATLVVDRDEPHTFRFGNSTMTGTRLTLKKGVRSIMLESGWTRTPAHGIMRDKALAVARVTHFGLPKNGQEIGLVFKDDLPEWLISGSREVFTADDAARHIALLVE